MRTEQLAKKVRVSKKGYGTYMVEAQHYHETLHATTHNSIAYDRLHSDATNGVNEGGYTYRGALIYFYNEALRANGFSRLITR